MNQILLKMSQKEEKEKLAIITSFMAYTLENDQYPKSVFKFCKENKLEEKNFYKFFGSLDGVKQTIWESFYDNVMSLLEKDENFEMAKPKEKLLSFYFVRTDRSPTCLNPLPPPPGTMDFHRPCNPGPSPPPLEVLLLLALFPPALLGFQ